MRGIGERQGGQTGLVDLQNRDVRVFVGSDHFGRVLFFVGERYFHVRGAVDHVVIGQDVAIRTHHNARTKTGGAL